MDNDPRTITIDPALEAAARIFATHGAPDDTPRTGIGVSGYEFRTALGWNVRVRRSESSPMHLIASVGAGRNVLALADHFVEVVQGLLDELGAAPVASTNAARPFTVEPARRSRAWAATR